MPYIHIKDAKELKGKRVLLRLDFNVPIRNGKVANDYRIRKALPTIEYLVSKGSKIIMVSHIESEEETLKPVYEYLKNIIPLQFVEDFLLNASYEDMKDGDVILFENIRKYPEEKENDREFSKKLASLADIYVNNAISVSHRIHASVVGVTEYLPSYAGFLLQEEDEYLSLCFNPPHPFLFILGGAKFDTKLPLITKFIDIADTVFVGGALANNFFKEKSYEIGTSLVSEGDFNIKGLLENPKLVLPEGVTVEKGSERIDKMANQVSKDESILDAGSAAIDQLQNLIAHSKFILWNGPLGNYERGFKEPTLSLAKMIADSNAQSVVGGGDTLAAIAELGIENKFDFLSTAGGAMLDYLANENLPGIEALEKSAEKISK